jgi:hypothetical protein
MTRAPPLRPLVGGSFFTVLGVDADPDEQDADLDADPDERDAIHRGIHELPWWRDREGTCGGGIPRMRELPPSMCVSMFLRVRSGALHQRRRPPGVLGAGEGGGPS